MSVAAEQLTVAGRWLDAGRRVVCALLVDAEGSSPFEPGAFMLVDGAGAIEGSVTGRCVARDLAALSERRTSALRHYGAGGEALGSGLSVHLHSFGVPPTLVLVGA